MKKEQIENVLNNLASTGADFAEVFLEEKENKLFNYIDNCLDEFTISNQQGIGLRIAKDKNIYYGSTSDLSEDGVVSVVETLKSNINSEIIYQNIKLQELKEYHHTGKNKYSDLEIKEKLKELNAQIRKKDRRIIQVNIFLKNNLQNVTIANQSGLYKKENRIYTRLFIFVNFKDGENVSDVHFSKGYCKGNDFLDDISFDKIMDELVKTGIDKLYAKPCVGKVMPVVIASGFGGVLFHEACGHAMEAAFVAPHLSVLSDDLNKKIASSKVTIIDDGTLDGEWGSTQMDDEGKVTQKNILIKDGVLVNFLIDELNNRKMKMQTTGSGRRQDYTFAPTSRMTNTYLAPGTDPIEDMIKSISFGLYAKDLGGGQVSTETGDFNFSCDTAYMIRDGKIAECVKGATLIGNTKEILKEIEMVGPNLELGTGMCGSLSGSIPVNVGQPTIKVSNILVGGEKNE